MIRLDMIDRKILSELDINARISYSELGNKIRVAKETVKYRIEQLEKNRVIEGYYTVLNNAKIGYSYYRLYIRLNNASPEIERKIEKYFMESKYVSILFTSNGPYHVVLGIWVKNLWEYEKFWFEFKKLFGEYIGDCQFSGMTNYVEFGREYLQLEQGGRKKEFSVMQESETEEVSEVDMKILRFLANNARASLVKIAEKTGLSIVTARQRIKNLMKKNVILGYRASLNLAMLGREYYKVDLWLRNFRRRDEIERYVRALPETAYAERTIITSDIEFDVEVEGFESFTRLMERIKEKFPEDIRDYRYYSRIESKKVVYVPSL